MRRLVLLACALIVCGVDTRTQHSGDLALILAGLAERTQQYYDRFISIICTETVQTQNLKSNLAPVGRPRTTVYELSVSRDSSDKREHEFRVERTLQSVNGRPARKNQRAECTDPKTGTPEPLGFLLAANQTTLPVYRRGRGRRSCRARAPSTSSRRRPSACASRGKATASKPKAAVIRDASGSIPETYDIVSGGRAALEAFSRAAAGRILRDSARHQSGKI